MNLTSPAETELDHAGHHLVHLDPDHPGFRDPLYRARRNAIARLALDYAEGEPVPRVDYTEEEHAVWRTVWDHLDPLHAELACHPWRESARRLALDHERIPQLREINKQLAPASGIRMLPVAGLIAGHEFLGSLSRGVFLSTQYMRHASRPLYTPEPDVVHELIGHATSFFDPAIVRLTRRFGEAALTTDETTARQLERAYWYTLEFGVVKEGGALKAYGAGLLSSFGELGEFSRQATIRPLDLEEVSQTDYDPTSYQKVLFAAESFDAMAADVERWLVKISSAAALRR